MKTVNNLREKLLRVGQQEYLKGAQNVARLSTTIISPWPSRCSRRGEKSRHDQLGPIQLRSRRLDRSGVGV